MDTLDVKRINIYNIGNNLDEISWSSLEQILRQHFSVTNIIWVCNGKIKFPSPEIKDSC